MKIHLKFESTDSSLLASCLYCLKAEHYFLSPSLFFPPLSILFQLLVPSIFSIFPTPYISIYKTLPALMFLSPFSLHFFSHLAISLFFSLSSSSMAGLMHSHHLFIHADVLFIKASIIQPTPQHLSLLRPTSHSFATLLHPNTWYIPGGQYTPSYFPLLLGLPL